MPQELTCPEGRIVWSASYRHFDPHICSFISQDPIGLAGGDNVYAYAPNVWGWVDPLGLCADDASKNMVQTPHGTAVQGSSAEAQAALNQARSGSQVYRQGQFGVQNTADAQFWATQNPANTSGFADQLGMPNSRVDWMMGGTVKPGANLITRPAPGIGTNVGGAMEAAVDPGGVKLKWFHMP